MRSSRFAAILFLCLSAATTQADQAAPEPAGYRMSDFRGTVPATLDGQPALSVAEAHALWEKKAAAFVDVLPQAPKPAGLAPGTLWRDKPRFDIPGSIWLPDTGYGALAPVTLVLIAIGGVLYSAGVVFHVWESLRFQNAIWHGFVLAAAACHSGGVMTSVV